MGKKIHVSYFFMKNPYMKFQNPSMHGSEVMLCIKKRNGQTDAQTNARTNVPEAICPSNFFEVGGINIQDTTSQFHWVDACQTNKHFTSGLKVTAIFTK